MEKSSSKKIVLQIVLFLVFFAMAFFATQYILSDKTEKGNSLLIRASKELNAQLPEMLDSDTRLDSTSVENETLKYHYTLVNFPKDNIEVDFDAVKSKMIKKTQDNLDTNPEMKEYRDNNFSLHYIYVDKNKNPVFDYTIKHQKQ